MSNEKTAFLACDDESMVEVAKDFIFDGLQLPTDVFLRVNRGQYLLVGKKDQAVQLSGLHSFRHPDTTIHVKKPDYNHFIRQMTDFTENIVLKRKVPESLKARFMNNLMDNVISTFAEKNVASMDQLKQMSKMMADMTQQMKYSDDLVALLQKLPGSYSRAAVGTCMISLLIAEELGITLPATLEKVSLGALLHDLGMITVPEEILAKPKHLWSPEEIKIYENHPIRGADLIRQIPGMTHDILLIVVEHHENSSGTGFPKGLRDVKLNPLGKIIALSNTFTSLILSSNTDGRIVGSDEAIAYIDSILGQPFNKQIFTALKNVINKNYMKNKQAA